METKEVFTGVGHASGKAKGAYGVANMLTAVQAIAAKNEFDATAEQTILDVRTIARHWWAYTTEDNFSGEYHAEEFDGQSICYGNVWMEIGRGYTISVHWDFISHQHKRTLEIALLGQDGSLLTKRPIRVEGQVDDDVADALCSHIAWLRQLIGDDASCEEAYL